MSYDRERILYWSAQLTEPFQWHCLTSLTNVAIVVFRWSERYGVDYVSMHPDGVHKNDYEFTMSLKMKQCWKLFLKKKVSGS